MNYKFYPLLLLLAGTLSTSLLQAMEGREEEISDLKEKYPDVTYAIYQAVSATNALEAGKILSELIELIDSEVYDLNAFGGPLVLTPLEHAAAAGSLELAKLLLQKGADPKVGEPLEILIYRGWYNIRDDFSLSEAKANAHFYELFKTLVEAGAYSAPSELKCLIELHSTLQPETEQKILDLVEKLESGKI